MTASDRRENRTPHRAPRASATVHVDRLERLVERDLHGLAVERDLDANPEGVLGFESGVVVGDAPRELPVRRRVQVHAVLAVEGDDVGLVEQHEADRRTQRVPALRALVLDAQVRAETAVPAAFDVTVHLPVALRTHAVGRETEQVADALVERRHHLLARPIREATGRERVLAVGVPAVRAGHRDRLVDVRGDERRAAGHALAVDLERRPLGVVRELASQERSHDRLPRVLQLVAVLAVRDELPDELLQVVVELRAVPDADGLAQPREPDDVGVGLPERLQDREPRLVAYDRERLRGLDAALALRDAGTTHTRSCARDHPKRSRNRIFVIEYT